MNSFSRINETLCTIWYHLYNLKNVKSTHGGVLLLVMLLTKTCNFTKVTLLYGCFPRFLNCTDGRKSRKVSQMNQGSFAGIASNIFMKRPESHCNLSSLYMIFTYLCKKLSYLGPKIWDVIPTETKNESSVNCFI